MFKIIPKADHEHPNEAIFFQQAYMSLSSGNYVHEALFDLDLNVAANDSVSLLIEGLTKLSDLFIFALIVA